jgi:hypothetical protein
MALASVLHPASFGCFDQRLPFAAQDLLKASQRPGPFLGAMAATQAGLIFHKDDIERPLQALDAPVIADRPG